MTIKVIRAALGLLFSDYYQQPNSIISRKKTVAAVMAVVTFLFV